MLRVGVIGHGAIAQYLAAALPGIGAELVLAITRPGRGEVAKNALGPNVRTAEALGLARPDVVVDCAGHEGLRQHGADILRAGVPLITVSIGALSDDALHQELTKAAQVGRTALHLSTGAIGGLDALASARVGSLQSVTYTGRKPPAGWKGSPAEEVLDLDALTAEAATHFEGSARDAAAQYPKNANVAAAVAIAGVGFDNTRVSLIADPNVHANIHEIHATGDFGELTFTISGKTLPGNARTSALAAMSVVKMVAGQNAAIGF
ncbi:aspartate dehydrogenase [Aliiroseovarius sp. YM-037]|uniref:aspartate dehydrogenase n=1 Tax=Aliiroseovarius sp. YM-037 TaxID=3341728 RepID=UPI003A8136D3